MNGIQEKNTNNIVLLIVEKINGIIEDLIKENSNKMISINIEYFYDGDFTDLGVKVRFYNEIMEVFRDKYYSFMLNDKELSLKISSYLNDFKIDEKFFQLKLLVKNIKNCLENNSFYWINDIKEITAECYD